MTRDLKKPLAPFASLRSLVEKLPTGERRMVLRVFSERFGMRLLANRSNLTLAMEAMDRALAAHEQGDYFSENSGELDEVEKVFGLIVGFREEQEYLAHREVSTALGRKRSYPHPPLTPEKLRELWLMTTAGTDLDRARQVARQLQQPPSFDHICKMARTLRRTGNLPARTVTRPIANSRSGSTPVSLNRRQSQIPKKI